jgi:uncharacterized membrane protein
LHDEARIFEREVREAGEHGGTIDGRHFDPYAFTLSFKGVFLEGLEVAFIVVTVGAAHENFALPIIGATAALIAVAVTGAVVHRPLSRVPENTMKLVVGIMLVTFGTFWGAEGAGVEWPGGDVMILGVLAFYCVLSFVLVEMLNRRGQIAVAGAEG